MANFAQQYWQRASPSIGYGNFEKRWGAPTISLLQRSGLLDDDVPKDNKALKILDQACGMGFVTAVFFDFKEPSESDLVQVVCGDISPAMLNGAKARIEKMGWKGVTAQIVDAQDSKFPDNTFSHVICSFGYALMPKPSVALEDSVRILQPCGVLGFTAWTEVGWIADMNTALARLNKPALANPVTDGWMDAQYIRSAVGNTPGLDLTTLKMEEQVVDSRMRDAEEWTTEASGMLGMITATWTEEQKRMDQGNIMPELKMVLEERYGKGMPFSIRNVAVIVTVTKKGPKDVASL